MMIDKAIKALTSCESDLRTLVASAADSGDYEAVIRITSWAKQLSTMASCAAVATTASAQPAPPSKVRQTGKAYPRFARRGDQLVKFGWSKTDKSEYEHKAPRHNAMLLAKAAAEAGKGGRIFQISALAPLYDDDQNGVPDYQAYLVIAWWRGIGILDQHGRQGYSIAKASQFIQSVEAAWSSLPEE